jgi:hypothetical protein
MSQKMLAVATLLLALAVGASAQTFSPRTDAFAFDATTAITSWDGSDPANPPYPYEMGSVNINTPSGIDIPWQLGYLNNGYLVPCDPIAWGSKIWVIGNGTHNGDTYILPGSATCSYFTGEYGTSGNSANILDGFSVAVKYTRQFHTSCGRGGCHTVPVDTLQGGTGTAQQTLIN